MKTDGLAIGGLQVLGFAWDHARGRIQEVHLEADAEAEVHARLKGLSSKSFPIKLTTRKNLEMKLDPHDRDGRHGGVVGVYARPKGQDLEDALEHAKSGVLVALDGIQDTHNLGAIARSALLMGADGLLFPSDRAASVTAGAVRASSGALLLNQFCEVTNLSQSLRVLKEAGYWIAGLSAGDEQEAAKEHLPFARLPEYSPLVIVVGSEQKGLRHSTVQCCDFTVSIPLKEQYQSVSLNASVAAAVALQSLGLMTPSD